MDDCFYDLRNDNEIDEWRAVARRALLHTIWERYGQNHQKLPLQMLDIGCGTGITLQSFTDIAVLWGIDISPLAVQICSRRGLERVFQATSTEMPFRSDIFGLITMTDVLEHVSDERLTLSELYRVCPPGGLAILIVPAFQFLWSNRDERLHHQRRYILRELKAKVEDAGFYIQKCSYIDSFLFLPLLMLVKLGLLSGKKPLLRMDIAPRNPLLDRFWLALARLERALLRWVNLPLGISILCVAEKQIPSSNNP